MTAGVVLLAKSVAVIVPAFQEQALIAQTLRTVPSFVDAIYVVDDASTDQTASVARAHADGRVKVLRHDVNRGVGAALVTGYSAALDDFHDILCVMAGDAQMDPADLEGLVLPIAHGTADYVKGNRFNHPHWREMPPLRRWAGRMLSWLTRRATRLAVSDTQCGYTALSSSAAKALPLQRLWPRYGYPNDLLGWLAQGRHRVVEVPVRPVYAQEQSGVRPWHVLSIVVLLMRAWWRCSRGQRLARQAVEACRNGERRIEATSHGTKLGTPASADALHVEAK